MPMIFPVLLNLPILSAHIVPCHGWQHPSPHPSAQRFLQETALILAAESDFPVRASVYPHLTPLRQHICPAFPPLLVSLVRVSHGLHLAKQEVMKQ